MSKRWPWGILIGWAAVQPFNIAVQAWVGMVISGAVLLSLFFIIGYLLQRKPAHRHGVPVYHERKGETAQMAIERLELEKEELLNALDNAHSVERCPYNQNGLCKPCTALQKYKDQIPEDRLVSCVSCGVLIRDTFKDRKEAWCEVCASNIYVCASCRADHNVKVHDIVQCVDCKIWIPRKERHDHVCDKLVDPIGRKPRYQAKERTAGIHNGGWNVWDEEESRFVSQTDHAFYEAQNIARRLNENQCRCASSSHALFCPQYVPPPGVDH